MFRRAMIAVIGSLPFRFAARFAAGRSIGLSGRVVREGVSSRLVVRRATTIVALMAAGVAGVRGDEPIPEPIRDLLATYCADCHEPSTGDGQLDLASLAGLQRGGESGPVVVPGRADESPLYVRIRSGDMPPDDHPRPDDEQVERLRVWIDGGAAGLRPTDDTVDLSQVIPILWLRCVPCHGHERREGSLDLRTIEGLRQGGEHGPVVIAGDAAASRLVQRIESGEMPPRRLLVSVSVKPMEGAELTTLRRWIDAGMPTSHRPIDIATTEPDPLVTDEDRNFPSFRPSIDRPSPTIRNLTTALDPIDAFLLERLQPLGLDFASPAPRHRLLRRLSFDLLGLPPEGDDVRAFIADERPDALERQVDRWLASPAFGERQARFWLDAAGYADSEGGQNEDRVRGEMWRYRDYVIRAFDDDRPYDRFLIEQLAGDELFDWRSTSTVSPEQADQLVATGFLRTAPDRTFAEITNFVPDRQELIADELRILGSSILGLSLHCARCHDHKFDPIPQRDYYRMAATLKEAYDEHDWLAPDARRLNVVSTDERTAWEAAQREIDRQIAKLGATIEATTDEGKRTSLVASRDALERDRPSEPMIRALWSRGRPSPTFMLRRGNYLMPAQEVGPGVLSVLTDGRTPFVPPERFRDAPTLGYRTAFAEWLVEPRHPLTWRVMANRWWSRFFGRGIVPSLDEFGRAGREPTHPELLDRLAIDLADGGSPKRFVRRLVLTAAYRQNSELSPDAAALDPDGTLLSRMPLRRVEAEVLRDAMLATAGRLDRRRFGPADDIDERDDGLVTVRSTGPERRSIYVLQRRTKLPTLLESFDLPAMNPNCLERDESLVPLQALQLTNDRRMREWAEAFAERVRIEAGDDPAARIIAAHRLAYGRDPDTAALHDDLAALAELATAWESAGKEGNAAVNSHRADDLALIGYCHAMLGSAEFQYVD